MKTITIWLLMQLGGSHFTPIVTFATEAACVTAAAQMADAVTDRFGNPSAAFSYKCIQVKGVAQQ